VLDSPLVGTRQAGQQRSLFSYRHTTAIIGTVHAIQMLCHATGSRCPDIACALAGEDRTQLPHGDAELSLVQTTPRKSLVSPERIVHGSAACSEEVGGRTLAKSNPITVATKRSRRLGRTGEWLKGEVNAMLCMTCSLNRRECISLLIRRERWVKFQGAQVS
jgi:hypothetical protein